MISDSHSGNIVSCTEFKGSLLNLIRISTELYKLLIRIQNIFFRNISKTQFQMTSSENSRKLLNKALKMEMPGIEPGAFHMQSERATTALHPPHFAKSYSSSLFIFLCLFYCCVQISDENWDWLNSGISVCKPNILLLLCISHYHFIVSIWFCLLEYFSLENNLSAILQGQMLVSTSNWGPPMDYYSYIWGSMAPILWPLCVWMKRIWLTRGNEWKEAESDRDLMKIGFSFPFSVTSASRQKNDPPLTRNLTNHPFQWSCLESPIINCFH